MLSVVPRLWKNAHLADHTIPLTTVEISMGDLDFPYMMNDKLVIFLVDTSGSMSVALPSVKASLLAFRDVVVGNRSGDDVLFRSRCNVELISFSSVVKNIWSSKSSSPTFEEAIGLLESGGQTNMGDALKGAFLSRGTAKFTWIVCLTDGASNTGSCQTLSAFSSLIKPEDTKIITLGYGVDIVPEILMAIGSFTYLEDIETIFYFMGALYHEISTSKFFDVKIVPDAGTTSIIGSHDVGVMANDRSFIFGIEAEVDEVTIKYKTLTDVGEQIYHTSLPFAEQLPNHIIRAYYESEAAKLIEMLYKDALSRGPIVLENEIRKIVSKWTSEDASPSREKVLRLISRARKSDYHSAVRIALSAGRDSRTQSSYTNPLYMSPSTIKSAKATVVYARKHLYAPRVDFGAQLQSDSERSSEVDSELCSEVDFGEQLQSDSEQSSEVNLPLRKMKKQ